MVCHPRPPTLLFIAIVLAVLTAGCGIRSQLGRLPPDGGSSPDLGSPDLISDERPDGRTTDRNGAAVDGTEDGVGGSTLDGAIALACAPGSLPRTAPVVLRRLTNFEYNNTVRDIFADSTHPADSLFDNGTSPLDTAVGAVLASGYHQLAHDFAIAATKDPVSLATLIACDVAVMGDTTCHAKLMEVISRAFRRPLDATDLVDFDLVFATGQRLGGTFASGVRAVLEVALQSPEFLYRVELGQSPEVTQPLLARPTPYEMAARLSYLLWGSAPDAQLQAAAAQNTLQTKDQIAAQVRRMLGDPRVRDVVRTFTLRLLHLDAPQPLSGRTGIGPFTEQLAGLMMQETSAYIDEVTWQGPADFQSLLTAPFTFMNASLASFYGVSGITGDFFRRVAVNPKQRIGLLTQASFLASTSLVNTTNPVRRGALIYREFLCGALPPEPANVPDIPPVILASPTTRQRYEQHAMDPACAECHRDIDPIGFAFEHYDSFGQWRDIDNGQAVDATGEIFRTDAAGKFDGAIELVQRLAQSRDAQACYVKQWMAFGYGREESPEDACSQQFLQQMFSQARGNIRELLFALTQTDAFLYRQAR